MMLITLGASRVSVFDLDLRRTLLDLSLDKLVDRAGIFVRQLLRLELARLLLDEIHSELYGIGLGSASSLSK
jgi:hypothetical protein